MRKEKLTIPFGTSYLSAMLFYPLDTTTKLFPVVCKAHGLVSNEFLKEEELAKMFTEEGFAYLSFHFSGFYESPGMTSIQTSLANLDTVVSYISHHPIVDPRFIGLYGVSLGAAIAIIHAARDRRIAAVALQAPLFDFSFVAEYPEFDALWDGLASTGLVRLPQSGVKETLLKDMRGNNPLECADKISPRPLLIIAGAEDTFIPLEGIKQLYKKAISPKQFELIEKADHNLFNSEARIQTFQAIRNFFREQHLAL